MNATNATSATTRPDSVPPSARGMDAGAAADQLERQAKVVAGLAWGIDDEAARRRPEADAWSLLEVICHLLDEEREDFGARLRHLLGPAPDDPLPPIDPQGWVIARGYNARSLEPVLSDFLAERTRTVAWLRSLESPAWDNVNHHPAGFELRAGDMLAAWVDHDLHHIRQLTELRHALLVERSAPYLTLYAGEW